MGALRQASTDGVTMKRAHRGGTRRMCGTRLSHPSEIDASHTRLGEEATPHRKGTPPEQRNRFHPMHSVCDINVATEMT